MGDYEFMKGFGCLPSRYEFVCKLGFDSLGKIAKFKDKKMPLGQQEIIIKLYRFSLDLIHAKHILREISILRNLKHENIVKLRHVLLARFKNDNKINIFFILDFWMINLNDIIDDRKNDNHLKLSDNHIKFIMYQLLKATSFLHNIKCMHCNINPTNIMINSQTKVVFTDFFYAQIFDQEFDIDQTPGVSLKIYQAPEIIFLEKYDKKGDIWALGWIFFQLIQGKHLIKEEYNNIVQVFDMMIDLFGTPSKNYQKLITSERKLEWLKKKYPTKPKKIFSFLKLENKEAVNLLEKMLCFDYRKRISATEALEHPYFKPFQQNSLNSKLKKVSIKNTIKNEIFIKYLHVNDKIISLDKYKSLLIKEINLINKQADEVIFDSWESIPLHENFRNPYIPIDFREDDTSDSLINSYL